MLSGLDALSEAATATATSSAAPTRFRPLTGIEDLTVFYGLTRTYKRYARDTPPTYEHLIAHIPGPALYTHNTAQHNNTSAPTPPTHVSDKATLLTPLVYPPTLPPPLSVRPLTPHQLASTLTFAAAGALGVVAAEVASKEARQRAVEEERTRRRMDKKSKKGERLMMMKRKGVDGGGGGAEGDDGKRARLDGGCAMIDIS